MIHLCTRITIDPDTLKVTYRAACGICSDDRKLFAKIAGMISTTLAGVDCPKCLGKKG